MSVSNFSKHSKTLMLIVRIKLALPHSLATLTILVARQGVWTAQRLWWLVKLKNRGYYGKSREGRLRMVKDIIMKINCVECGKRHNITNDKLDDYNIYWVKGGKLGFIPKLLCPVCTIKLRREIKNAYL